MVEVGERSINIDVLNTAYFREKASEESGLGRREVHVTRFTSHRRSPEEDGTGLNWGQKD